MLERIAVEKDVDGFHLYNVGGLMTGNTVFPPCTPFGVQKLLEYEKVPIEGQNVVVVGASNIVGKPMALMLMQQDATVCICHKKTKDLAQFTMLADILVVAAGVPGLIVPQMVKTGVVVIDVGINRLPDGRLVGDVDFEGVRQKASLISPVPGGVGPDDHYHAAAQHHRFCRTLGRPRRLISAGDPAAAAVRRKRRSRLKHPPARLTALRPCAASSLQAAMLRTPACTDEHRRDSGRNLPGALWQCAEWNVHGTRQAACGPFPGFTYVYQQQPVVGARS